VNCREMGDKIHTTLFSTKGGFLLEKEKLLKWMLGSHCTMVKAYHSAFSSILGAYALLRGLSEH